MLNRSLANLNESSSGKIVGLGNEIKKKYVLSNIIEPEIALYHHKRLLWIHDLEFYDISYNCVGISTKNLLGDKKITFSNAIRKLYREIIKLTNEQSGGIGFINFDSDLAYYITDETDEEITEEISQLYNDLNVHVRKGCEKAYVTFNFGLDVTKNGRRVIEAILNAYLKGDEDGRPFIFPNLVFKLKSGVNINSCDKNFDMLQKACNVTSKCMIPTYLNCDSIINRNVDSHKLGILGCRTRVVENIFGEETTLNRGNIACVTINLVQIAIESKNDINKFKESIEEIMNISRDLLIHRFNCLCSNSQISYIREKEIFQNNTKSNEDIFKNGTLSVGFIGLWDAIGIIVGKTITKEDILVNLRDLAYDIVSFMGDKVEEYKEKEKMNFSLLASSAEGVCGEFAKFDKEKYANKNIKLEKDYYTNSFHVPVDLEFSYFEKIIAEAPFHKLCKGGSISYVELNEMPSNNIEGILDIVNFARNEGCNYIGINFPLDSCCNCGFIGTINDNCTICNSNDVLRLRRVSGYLAQSDRFTKGKLSELRDRVSHVSKNV